MFIRATFLYGGDMKITLLDGSQKEYQEAKSGYDIALDISEGLARNAVAI